MLANPTASLTEHFSDLEDPRSDSGKHITAVAYHSRSLKIENRVHWFLDVVFREDHCRPRKGRAAQNFAFLRHMALSLLQKEKSVKVGVKAKRLKAALDENYLMKVLTG